MNRTERLLYGLEPNAKERLEDLSRDFDHDNFEVEPPSQHEVRYYDEQLKNKSSCAHDNCGRCHGSGQTKLGQCVHMLVCKCDKCSINASVTSNLAF